MLPPLLAMRAQCAAQDRGPPWAAGRVTHRGEVPALWSSFSCGSTEGRVIVDVRLRRVVVGAGGRRGSDDVQEWRVRGGHPGRADGAGRRRYGEPRTGEAARRRTAVGSALLRTAVGDERRASRSAAEPGNVQAAPNGGMPDVPGAGSGVVGGGVGRGQGEGGGGPRSREAALEVAHGGGGRGARMRVRCSHAESWTYPVPGEQRCRTCGTVRFTDYGALRPPGLPQALTPKPRDAGKADRAAATRIAKAPRRGWDPWFGRGSEQAGSGGRGEALSAWKSTGGAGPRGVQVRRERSLCASSASPPARGSAGSVGSGG
ncbi:DUF6255 family natural product biosynthesis protein [Streptomyces klenkii]|uniref:DUF6255 family natural product biosynthesis protein n=1 Tax=Streptomyces klenkii TaxID=1420899 RepID=UPI0036EF051A